MPYTITVPGQGKDLQTKDMILSILALEYPLTAKQLTNKIRKQFGSTVTFQAVYKAANQLIEGSILEKEGMQIKISKGWIRDAKSFIDGLQKRYLEDAKPGTAALASENVQVYEIDNLIDLDKFWIGICESWYDDPALEDDKVVQLCGHAWYVLGQLENEEECLRNIHNHGLKFYTLVDGDDYLDRWSGKYYTDWGFEYRTKRKGGSEHHNHYYVVYADMIIETVYPERLARDLDEIYRRVKDIKDLDLNQVIKILRRKEKLKITVMKNKPLASQLREGILSHWR